MIGDRAVDITATKANNLRSIGVLWGHGSQLELEQVNPDWIIKSPSDLIEFAAQL